jgi:hypothetical protein
MNKYEWIKDLDADELRVALHDMVDENSKLKSIILAGNSKSSILLIKNTKGTNIEVKAYHDDIVKASEDAQKEYDKLLLKYKSEE